MNILQRDKLRLRAVDRPPMYGLADHNQPGAQRAAGIIATTDRLSSTMQHHAGKPVDLAGRPWPEMAVYPEL